jgi:hypothetical protein
MPVCPITRQWFVTSVMDIKIIDFFSPFDLLGWSGFFQGLYMLKKEN